MGMMTASLLAAVVTLSAAGDGWRAGVARVDITPAESMWLAGYAARTRPAEGTIHALWVKALAVEDADGHRALIITSDILGFPKPLTDRIVARLEKETGLGPAQIILNSSHTHSGPVVEDSLMCIYPLDDAEKEKIRLNTAALEEKTVAAGLEALADLAPARLEAANGVARLAVNRRNNKEAEILTTHHFNGPVDHAVPVLRVTGADGATRALLFGYACHNTVLDGLKWCGDYAGFAQAALEQAHPGAVALFFQGCGANQNPLPRRTLSLARKYGADLAAAVECALAEPMTVLEPSLATARTDTELLLETPITREKLEGIRDTDKGYMRRAALEMLAELDAGRPLRGSYPFPVQVWRLGGLPLVAFAGETVVDYAIHAKTMLGPEAFVMGYSNDVMSYIPTAAIVQEGGYEGDSSQLIYGMPAKWRGDIETRILDALRAAALDAGLAPKE